MTYLRFLSFLLVFLGAASLASAQDSSLCQRGFSYFSGKQALCSKAIRKTVPDGPRNKVDLVWACHNRNPDNPPDQSGCGAGGLKMPGDILIREGEIFLNDEDTKVGSNGARLPDGPYHCCFTRTPPPNDLFRSSAIEPIVID